MPKLQKTTTTLYACFGSTAGLCSEGKRKQWRTRRLHGHSRHRDPGQSPTCGTATSSVVSAIQAETGCKLVAGAPRQVGRASGVAISFIHYKNKTLSSDHFLSKWHLLALWPGE